jgi:uncharacterized phage protein gp47/JayE
MEEIAAVMAEEAAKEQVQQQQEQAPAGPDLNIQDLVGLKSVIDVATQRGAFKAAEMEAIGKLYNRLNAFIESVAKPKEQ